MIRCEAYHTVNGWPVLKHCVFLHPHRHSVLRLSHNSFHVASVAMGIGKVVVYYWCSSDSRYFLWYEMNSAFVRHSLVMRSLMTLMRKFGELRVLDKLSYYHNFMESVNHSLPLS